MPDVVQFPIREAVGSDRGFIFSSWLRSYQKAPQWQFCDNRTYFEGQHKRMDEIVKRSSVLVTCNPAERHQIIGWVVYEVTLDKVIFHYVYVKDVFRGHDVATGMVNAVLQADGGDKTVWCSHMTKQGVALRSTMDVHVTYDPTIDQRTVAPWL